jgi:hypothetical protein
MQSARSLQQLHSSKPRPEGPTSQPGFCFFCGIFRWPGYYLHPQRNSALPKQKENKMNTKVLLLGAVVTAFTFTTFARDALLTPRAAGNQPQVVNVAAPAVTIAYVAPASTPISPRAQASQSKVIQGTANNQDSTRECRKNMVTSPKAVAECAAHTTMPGCTKLASLK